MQYEAKTPKEYLEQLENDWKKDKLMLVREMIKKHGPDLVERIEYKMLSYAKDEKSIFNLNAQRAYVSLYVGTINKVADAQELLKDFDTGKGCVRIKKKVSIPDTGLEVFIKRTIEIWEKGGNTELKYVELHQDHSFKTQFDKKNFLVQILEDANWKTRLNLN